MSCGGCGKDVSGRVLSAMDKKWHPECFKCFDCSGELAGGYALKNGDPICKPCAAKLGGAGGGGGGSGKPCGKCEKPLSGSCINAIGKTFHKDCFVCTDCEGSIASGFSVIEDQPYCKECATKKAPKQQQQASDDKKCAECDKPLSGSCVNSGDNIFHKDCFKCKACQSTLSGGCAMIDGHPHCKDCAAKLNPQKRQSSNSGQPCAGCGEPLTGACVSSGDATYHKPCFKCKACQAVLTDGCKLINDEPHCKDCATKILSADQEPDKLCNQCGKALSGTCVSAGEMTLHKACFKCTSCEKGLQGGYRYDLLEKNTFYCRACFPKRPGVCTGCGTRKAGGQFCGGCGTKIWTTF